MTTVIKNGQLVSGSNIYQSDLLIRDDLIEQIGQNLSGDKEIDASGCLVFPGFIDAHTHMDMPVSGTVTADNFETGSIAALAGGTTMLIDFATQDKGGTLAEALRAWHQKADGNCSCDYGFHMAITDWNEQTRSELQSMRAAGVTSFKCYYAYDALKMSDSEIYDILCEIQKIDGILGVHCENGEIINCLQKKALAKNHTGPEWHPKTRPALTEGEAIGRFLRIAKLTDATPWIVHLSTEDGLNEIRLARARGQKVHVESCPQYLALDENVYTLSDGFEAAKYVCSPPLRNKSDQEALWYALTNGEINILSTDHCSFNFYGQKDLGKSNFTKIPNGMPGIEHRPTIMYTIGVGSGKISVAKLCEVLSEQPAKMFGLYPQKGILAPGSDADITIYDPRKTTVISAETQYQNCDYTPYEGFHTVGQVCDVFLRGVHVVSHGKVVKFGLGQYITRKS